MANTIMKIIFFGWFLYRHAYHNWEWGRAEYEYEILSSGLHNIIIQDKCGVKHVSEEESDDLSYTIVVNSVKRNMKMHKFLANTSALLCAIYLLSFIIY